MSTEMSSVAETVAQQLELVAQTNPDTLAVIAPEGRITYAELAVRVADTAARLDAAGLRFGDRVGVLLPNGLRWVISTLALQSLGAVPVPISTWSRRTELERIASQTLPRMVITAESILGKNPLPLLEESGLPIRLQNSQAPYIGTLVWNAEDPVLDVALDRASGSRQDVAALSTALLLSTSGSTSMPKLVPLLHGDLLRNGHAIGERLHVVAGDKIWLGAPLFFSYGCANALPMALTHAATLCLQEGVDGNAALALIEEEACTVYYGFGPTTRKLVEASDFGTRDTSSLRTGTTGFSREEKALGRTALGIAGICSVYGMTEAYGHSAMTDADDDDETFFGTQGRVLPTQQLRIASVVEGEVLVNGEDGEIQLHGAVTPGYIGIDPSGTFTADGWLRTGDIGHLDAEDRLVYTDRLKSLLKINGINVAPAEIESILLEHDSVEQAFVFGEYVEGVQRVVAALVTQADCNWDEFPRALTGFVKERAASYKVPARFVRISPTDVPTTDTGKVNKRLLAEQLTLVL
jgi:acyl-CoA synthetase (AMP-forming)/AMP-acid ligase II